MARLGAGQRTGLRLRHLEPVRWAAANRSAWLGASREQLFTELTGRLTGRRVWLNTEGSVGMDGKSHETPHDWNDKLTWGDLLSILVIDEAVHTPAVSGELFSQAAVDQADTSTEYGGLLWSADQGGIVPGTVRHMKVTQTPGAFALRSYPPRTTERKDDRTFMAAEEMFKDGAARSRTTTSMCRSPTTPTTPGRARAIWSTRAPTDATAWSSPASARGS